MYQSPRFFDHLLDTLHRSIQLPYIIPHKTNGRCLMIFLIPYLHPLSIPITSHSHFCFLLLIPINQSVLSIYSIYVQNQYKAMSIYSGFATRNLQQFYDKMLYNLISTLLLRVTKIYKREPVDENSFLKIVFGHEKSLRKMEKRKYLEPKYSELLTNFKRDITQEEEIEGNEPVKEAKIRAKEVHQLNRTLSLLGREFGQLRANVDRIEKVEKFDLEDNESQPSLAQITQRKHHVSKRKKKEKKSSIKSNLDIWDMRQERPPELPSLHPLQNIQRTLMSKTKFNSRNKAITDFSQRVRSKEIDEYPLDDEPQSQRNVLAKPPKFRAKMYFK